jgi:hypothetical protein
MAAVDQMVSNGASKAGSGKDAVKVVFIASASHSGSTLLDLLLNAHPDMVSVGELKQLGRYANFARKRGRIPQCTCGAPSLAECPFWGKVGALTEARAGQSLGELNVENYDDRASFDRDNIVLFSAIADSAGKRFIVDSSKNADRLERLLADPGLDVFPVFLLRDPKGQICSSLRKNNVNTWLGKNTYGLLRLIKNYVGTNRKIYGLVKDRTHAVIRYEELAANPERTLTPLMQDLGLAFHPDQLQWAAKERHNISGNRMRFGASSEVRLDEHWRDELTLAQRLAIDAGTFAGRYPFVKLGLR